MKASPLFGSPGGSYGLVADGNLGLNRGQWHGNVFVDGLALVIVLGIELAIRASNRLSRFVSFEAHIALLVLAGLLFVTQTVVTQH